MAQAACHGSSPRTHIRGVYIGQEAVNYVPTLQYEPGVAQK